MKNKRILLAVALSMIVWTVASYAQQGSFSKVTLAKWDGRDGLAKIPKGWTLVSVDRGEKLLDKIKENMWFKDTDGNVYLVTGYVEPFGTGLIVSPLVYSIPVTE